MVRLLDEYWISWFWAAPILGLAFPAAPQIPNLILYKYICHFLQILFKMLTNTFSNSDISVPSSSIAFWLTLINLSFVVLFYEYPKSPCIHSYFNYTFLYGFMKEQHVFQYVPILKTFEIERFDNRGCGHTRFQLLPHHQHWDSWSKTQILRPNSKVHIRLRVQTQGLWFDILIYLVEGFILGRFVYCWGAQVVFHNGLKRIIAALLLTVAHCETNSN